MQIVPRIFCLCYLNLISSHWHHKYHPHYKYSVTTTTILNTGSLVGTLQLCILAGVCHGGTLSV